MTSNAPIRLDEHRAAMRERLWRVYEERRDRLFAATRFDETQYRLANDALLEYAGAVGITGTVRLQCSALAFHVARVALAMHRSASAARAARSSYVCYRIALGDDVAAAERLADAYQRSGFAVWEER